MDLVREGEWAVLHATRHDDELPRPQVPVAIAELHSQASGDHEEELVLPLVVVPDELALELDQLHVAVIQLARDSRIPVVVAPRELLAQVHDLHDCLLIESTFAPNAPGSVESPAPDTRGHDGEHHAVGRHEPTAPAPLQMGAILLE